METPFRWENKAVLVTGAGGFIGSHLVEELLRLKADVYCFVRYNSLSRKGFLETISKNEQAKLHIISGDLEAQETVMQAAKRMEIIFHLGALISIPYSFLHPEETIRTNTVGTLNVLLGAREYGVKKTIIMSTSEVYGTARYVPIDEAHPLQAQSPYAASKIGAEKLAESFFRAYGLPVAIVRPFNTYGPRQSTRAVIPTIITQTLTRSEVRLGDISTTRDFTFVKDIVTGLILMAETPKTNGEVINLGSNSEISIANIVKLVSKITGREVTVNVEQRRFRPGTSEVRRLWAANEKAKLMLGWKPTVTLEDGLAQTVNWIKNNINMYEVDTYGI